MISISSTFRHWWSGQKRPIQVKIVVFQIQLVLLATCVSKLDLLSQGVGTLKCYGDASLSEDGTFVCTPSAPWAAYAPPQVVQ